MKTLSESNKYKLEYVNCPLCSKADCRVIIKEAKELYNGFDDTFDVVKCDNCQFVYTNPRPTKNSIHYFYPDNAGYYIPVSVKREPVEGFRSRIISFSLYKYFGYPIKLNSSKYNVILRGIVISLKYYVLYTLKKAHIPYYVQNGRLLEIGCSWGDYLARMQKLGWDVTGIEMNKNCVIYANNNLNLANVYSTNIEDIDFDADSFDVIRLNMVLEHLHDPVDCLYKIKKWLKSNGQLILSVPNFDGIEFQLFGRYCYALQVPQHLSFFDTRSLSNMLIDAGFVNLDFTFECVERDFLMSLKNNKSVVLFNFFSNRFVRYFIIKPVVFILSIFGKTSRMTVFSRKDK